MNRLLGGCRSLWLTLPHVVNARDRKYRSRLEDSENPEIKCQCTLTRSSVPEDARQEWARRMTRAERKKDCRVSKVESRTTAALEGGSNRPRHRKPQNSELLADSRELLLRFPGGALSVGPSDEAVRVASRQAAALPAADKGLGNGLGRPVHDVQARPLR